MFTLIMGVPNAGKTTYSGKYNTVIHLDDLGLIERVCQKIRQMGDDVVAEGVFASSSQRKRLIDSYTGEYKRCVFLNITLDECIKREDRGRPAWLLKNAYKYFEPPTYSEGWDEIIVIGDNYA